VTTLSRSGEADRRLEALRLGSTALSEFLDTAHVGAGEYD